MKKQNPNYKCQMSNQTQMTNFKIFKLEIDLKFVI